MNNDDDNNDDDDEYDHDHSHDHDHDHENNDDDDDDDDDGGGAEDNFDNEPLDLSPLHIWPSPTSTPLWQSCLFPLLLIAPGNTLLLRVNKVKVFVVHTGLCQIWLEDTK